MSICSSKSSLDQGDVARIDEEEGGERSGDLEVEVKDKDEDERRVNMESRERAEREVRWWREETGERAETWRALSHASKGRKGAASRRPSTEPL